MNHPSKRLCSTVEGVQHCGGISSVEWEDIQCVGEISSVQCGGMLKVRVIKRDTISVVEGYHQYDRECSVQLRDIISV